MVSKKALLVGLTVFLGTLAGCSSQVYVQMVPSGGDLQKGIVEMSYEYDTSREPVVDYTGAHIKAMAQCQTWGYTGEPEVVADIRYNCINEEKNERCYRYLVEVDYECKNPPEIKSALEEPGSDQIISSE